MGRVDIQLADHLGLIYVIAPEADGPCKIGFTSNLQNRLLQLQVGCWLPLKPYGVRVVVMTTGGTRYATMSMGVAKAAQKIERAAHKTLRDLGLGLAGEWFDISAADALRVIEKVAALNDAKVLTIEKVMSVDIDAGLDPATKKAQFHFAKMMGCVSAFIQHMNGDSQIVKTLLTEK